MAERTIGGEEPQASQSVTYLLAELTKKLWAYIRKNGLQDAKKRTLINADENLKAVFNGKKQVSMFEMTKLVSGHVKQ
jgi:chromatin remodeling complex protein RSC6